MALHPSLSPPPTVQIPVFVILTMTLRLMCARGWPGLASEGCLWFQDLTQRPLILATGEMPMGPVGE